MLRRLRVVSIWEMLAVRADVARLALSPLFRGMSRYQIRKLLLLCEERQAPAGTVLIAEGDVGSEMYLMLSGRVSVEVGRGPARKPLAQLETGDIFGEVGFVGAVRRTASVVAVEDTAVLALGQEAARQRLRYYPFIAAQLNHNIARILGERLAGTLRIAQDAPQPAAAG
jgi:CRP-like cAMP-binding protein